MKIRKLIIRFDYTACSKNPLISLFHFFFIIISQNKKEKRKIGFLSVEDRSTIDKKWKRVELVQFHSFPLLFIQEQLEKKLYSFIKFYFLNKMASPVFIFIW